MTARADGLDLHAPIMLSERGEGAPESMIVSGIASAADVLSYADGDDEITDGARQDTAEQLRGVPLVSPEDHQRWQQAQARGERYEVTPLGTVIEADQDESGAVRFSAAVHGSAAVNRVRRGEWPAVSVGYVAGYTRSDRADRAQARRTVNHLALVPRGRDPHARIRADGADMDEAALKALFAEFLAAMKPMIEEIIKGALKVEVDAIGDAAMPAEAMVEMKAQAYAAKARADAAEAKLSAIEKDQRKARAATLTTALAARGIKVSGYDLARADASDIAAAESALLDHALASQPRADQWGTPIQPSAAPATTSPTYKIV